MNALMSRNPTFSVEECVRMVNGYELGHNLASLRRMVSVKNDRAFLRIALFASPSR